MKRTKKQKWRSYLESMRLMYSFVRSSGQSPAKSREVEIGKRCYNFDIYSPLRESKSAGTVVVFHGMSPEGAKDDRIVHLCRCIAFAGYTVVCPDVPAIKNITISSAQIDMVAEILIWIRENLAELAADHDPKAKIGALAPSFTAGLLLAAASRPEVAEVVGSICSLGGFADVNKVLTYMFLEEGVDPYGRMVILKNFLRYSVRDSKDIEAVLHQAILANYFRLSESELDDIMDSISPAAKNEFREIMEDKEVRQTHLASILDSTKQSNEFELFDIKRYVKSLSSSVFLLHGSTDNVIPSSESVILYEELQGNDQLKDRSKMVLTPFISHGDTTLDFTVFAEIRNLVSGFAFFFREIHN